MTDLHMTIDGSRAPTTSTFDVINPATGQVFAQAPDCTPAQLDQAMAAAQAAYRTWHRDEKLRCELLLMASEAVLAHTERLAPLLVREQGKPLANARQEFSSAATWLRYYAELEVPREIVQDDAAGYAEVFRRPLGVVAAITPWNFPISLAMWKIAPALRAGNTMVLKPSPYTPLTTLALGELLQEIFPAGVLNIVTGLDPLGEMITAHPTPRKISFTGSTATGKHVMRSAASDLKRVTLELGGNDPAIVLDDADPAIIAEGLFWGAFANSGQICAAVKRVYVHESICAEVVDVLAELAGKVRIGDGMLSTTQIGPLNNKAQFDLVTQLVEDAAHRGARVAAGGAALLGDGYLFRPTVLSDLDDGVRVVDEEQFGPVLPVVSYRTVDDAVERANNSRYGLTASVWSSDPERAALVGLRLETGQVSINAHMGGVRASLPFGGAKWSGVGVENGPWGLASFSETQVITGPSRI
ncbi:aldehyde dehydrogenase family protein [Jatrophihabitans sp.]|uniref:aldehyde dehydrogenase family protein n=1 Tax=Jatrophihabitans sp. TaxID=1932789 RepID=UPI0030C6BAC5|nr:putative betaine-aldehyde dehydrogenase [Jatrophihabitans sp.]